MKTVEINVTDEDIKNGERADCELCPIACAARRAGIDYALVNTTYILVGPMAVRIALPTEAQAFVIEFDSGQPVQPFTFTIQIP
jgi:hypothetical protein